MNHYTTLEQSQRLKELGINQNEPWTDFAWYLLDGEPYCVVTDLLKVDREPIFRHSCSFIAAAHNTDSMIEWLGVRFMGLFQSVSKEGLKKFLAQGHGYKMGAVYGEMYQGEGETLIDALCALAEQVMRVDE